MAYIPKPVRDTDLSRAMANAGMERFHQGKVRDSYKLSLPGIRLIVTTDRVSTDDYVWPVLIPCKGKVLHEISKFWFTGPLHGDGIRTHFMAAGADIDSYLPRELRGNEELRLRGMVVVEKLVAPYEAIVRDYLTGSGWCTYRDEHKMPCGYPFVEGLYDGARLRRALFTPTTKSDIHDEPIPIAEFRKIHGRTVEDMSLRAFRIASNHLEDRGIIMADTKMEWALHSGEWFLVDEFGTPDSSRFWDHMAWAIAATEHKSPSGMDKEKLRIFGRGLATPWGAGIGCLDMSNTDHQKWVDEEMGTLVFSECISETALTYQKICRLITT